MATMIMASSKTLIPLPPTTTPKPKFPFFLLSLPKTLAAVPHIPSIYTSALKSSSAAASAIATALLAIPLPALAEEVEREKAALFEFNLTLPIMMIQFLALQVALDKIYFTPLGKFMDERDASIKARLAEVEEISAEVKQLEEEGAAVMRAARAEITAALNKMKKETQAEVDQRLAEGRRKVEAELQEALAELAAQKEETIKALDSQIAALSDEIVEKVLPSL